MKNLLLAALLCACVASTLLAQDKGYVTLLNSPTSTTAVYDGAVAKLKEAGVWETGWSFHALGAMQPTGLLSLGIYPDKASLDLRLAKTEQVFKTNNISVPVAQGFEIYNIVRPPFPAVKPVNAVMILHDVKGMTPEQYENILKELKAINAFGDPAHLFHVCYKTPEGLKVVDIWESPEALQKFAGNLMPILAKIFGAPPPPPAVYGLYNVVNKI